MQNKRLFGSLLLVITAILWGVAFVFQRTGMDHIGPLTFMASRCVLAVLSLGFILTMHRGTKRAFKISRETLTAGLVCGVVLTLANNLQQMGMVYTTAGKGGFITALYIILVPIANWALSRKRPKAIVFVAVLLGAAGLYLLSVKEDFTITKGDFLVMLCAVVFTVHIVVTDQFAAKIDPVQTSLIQFTVAAVLGWIWAFAVETPSIAGIWEAKGAIAYCGILSAGAGYTLQIFGQKYTEPTTASLIMSLEAIFAALAGWLILHETMSSRELIGCAIMFIAIIIVEIKHD